jgi:hypothetical protein
MVRPRVHHEYKENDEQHQVHDVCELERIEIAEQPCWFAPRLQHNRVCLLSFHQPEHRTKGTVVLAALLFR